MSNAPASKTGTPTGRSSTDYVTAPDGARLALWVEGSGPPLVLVHGALGDHSVLGHKRRSP
ncbi:MAG TPA: hypothetical protein VIT93_03120 [Dehalococcoidia bacterium]